MNSGDEKAKRKDKIAAKAHGLSELSPIALVNDLVPNSEPILFLQILSPSAIQAINQTRRYYTALLFLGILVPVALVFAAAAIFSQNSDILSRAVCAASALATAQLLVWSLKKSSTIPVQGLICITADRLVRIDVNKDASHRTTQLKWSELLNPLEGLKNFSNDTISAVFYSWSGHTLIDIGSVDRKLLLAATAIGSAKHYKKTRYKWYRSALAHTRKHPNDPHPKAMLALWCQNVGQLREAEQWRNAALEFEEGLHPEFKKILKLGKVPEPSDLGKLTLYDKNTPLEWNLGSA